MYLLAAACCCGYFAYIFDDSSKIYIARVGFILLLYLIQRHIFIGPGDDWEHEEIFTDDDEAVGNDPEEREDLAPEVPAPPEIKQVHSYTSL